MRRPSPEMLLNFVVLFACAAAWGLTLPLAKIAVSTGHLPFGLLFWQLVVSFFVLSVIRYLRERRFELSAFAWIMALTIAITGTVIPNSIGYVSARHLPAGVLSVIIATVPMFTLPIAVLMRADRATPTRLFGLLLGLFGVVLIVAPETSLPEAGAAAFVFLALLGPFFYGLEASIVDKFGTGDLGAVQMLQFATLLGIAMTLPLALASDQFIAPRWPLGAPEWALVLASLLHALAYLGYVWILPRTGSIFASQVAYLVTGFGVLFSMLLLGERYSIWIWFALGAMLAGIFFVQPRRSAPQRIAEGASR